MHNNYHFILHLAKELTVKLEDRQLGECFTQNKDELCLGFYNRQDTFYIICKLQQHFSVLNFSDRFSRAKRNTVDLWDEILDLKVTGVQTFTNERCFAIDLENEYTLLFKLFGNRSNVLLFQEGQPSKIFKKRLSSDLNTTLQAFERPIVQDFEAYEECDGNVAQLFPTFGKHVINYLVEKGYEYSTDKNKMLQNWSLIKDVLHQLGLKQFYLIEENERPKLTLLQVKYQKKFDDPIKAINEFSQSYYRRLRFKQLYQNLSTQLNKKLTRAKNYVLKNRHKLSQLSKGSSYHQIGDIIMANLHQIPARATTISLHNFYSDKPENIKLKRDLNPQQNAEWYYRKGKNQSREIQYIEKSIASKTLEVNQMESEWEAVQAATDFEQLKKLAKASPKVERRDSSPFKQFEFQGFKIWVGKNAKNNDLLTTRYAQKDDLWLHARDTPGSHVVIKNPSKNVLPPSTVIEYAAQLAAYYSKRKTEALCPVAYTFKKYVRKPKGVPAGTVILEKEQVILVEPLKP